MALDRKPCFWTLTFDFRELWGHIANTVSGFEPGFPKPGVGTGREEGSRALSE